MPRATQASGGAGPSQPGVSARARQKRGAFHDQPSVTRGSRGSAPPSSVGESRPEPTCMQQQRDTGVAAWWGVVEVSAAICGEPPPSSSPPAQTGGKPPVLQSVTSLGTVSPVPARNPSASFLWSVVLRSTPEELLLFWKSSTIQSMLKPHVRALKTHVSYLIVGSAVT